MNRKTNKFKRLTAFVLASSIVMSVPFAALAEGIDALTEPDAEALAIEQLIEEARVEEKIEEPAVEAPATDEEPAEADTADSTAAAAPEETATVIDTTVLQKLIDDAEKLDAAAYVDFGNVAKALESAKALLESGVYDQTAIDLAAEALRKAISELVQIEAPATELPSEDVTDAPAAEETVEETVEDVVPADDGTEAETDGADINVGIAPEDVKIPVVLDAPIAEIPDEVPAETPSEDIPEDSVDEETLEKVVEALVETSSEEVPDESPVEAPVEAPAEEPAEEAVPETIEPVAVPDSDVTEPADDAGTVDDVPEPVSNDETAETSDICGWYWNPFLNGKYPSSVPALPLTPAKPAPDNSCFDGYLATYKEYKEAYEEYKAAKFRYEAYKDMASGLAEHMGWQNTPYFGLLGDTSTLDDIFSDFSKWYAWKSWYEWYSNQSANKPSNGGSTGENSGSTDSVPSTPLTPAHPNLSNPKGYLAWAAWQKWANGNQKINNVIDGINNARRKAGLNPLSVSNELMSVAQTRVQELSSKFSHTRPDGTSCFTILATMTGENIQRGSKGTMDSASEVLSDLMANASLKANIYSADHKSIGVACYYDAKVDTYYWVQVFAD